MKGDKGEAGYIGADGTKGQKGEAGYVGSDGAKGDKGDTGSTGSKGDKGDTGSKGEQGNFGGETFEFTYVTTTTDTDPGQGKLGFSNTYFPDAGFLHINQNDINNANTYGFLLTIDDSTSSLKGHFKVYDFANVQAFAVYTITGSHVYNATPYFTVPVAHVTGTVTTFANNTNVAITFARSGDAGDKGATGDKGSTGEKGDTGAKGDTGTAGSKGDKGDTGSSGTDGTKGDKGDTGSQGAKGDTGTAGTKGDAGAKGDTGADGTKGDKGDLGTSGTKGDKGEAGALGAVEMTVDTFTGNGSNTDFTLSTTPTAEEYSVVNINGIIQQGSAYSVSGSTLTFTEAPANGDNIEVRTVAGGAKGDKGVDGTSGTKGDKGDKGEGASTSIVNARMTGYSLVFGG